MLQTGRKNRTTSTVHQFAPTNSGVWGNALYVLLGKRQNND
jgi:hypothetical protein